MPVTLVATVGADDANSYVGVAEADDYLGSRLNASAWTSASADAKAQALIQATRRLDEESWRGYPTNPLNGTSDGTTQALQWPRSGAVDRNGDAYADDVIPEPVKRATMELALHYLRQGSSDPQAPTGLEGIAAIASEVGVGPIKVAFRESGSPQAAADTDFPADIRRIVRTLLATPAGQVRLVRG